MQNSHLPHHSSKQGLLAVSHTKKESFDFIFQHLLWFASATLAFVILVSLIIIVGILGGLVWTITFHPTQIQPEAITCADNIPILQLGQSLKVLTHNVQYMAGKNCIFFVDNLDLVNAIVRQGDTLTVSDHLLVIAEFNLP